MSNPKKLFVISAITREQIAELLNDAMDYVGSGTPKFTKDDPRLTDGNCQAIADRLCDATDTSEEDDCSIIELAEEEADNDWLFKVPTKKQRKKS